MASNWYRSYFTEPYGEIYADYLLGPEIAREEAQFACQALELQPGHRVLDCPCGYGRHMDVLRSLFPGIVGVDLSPDCLRRARDLLLDLRVVRGDMRALPLASGAFDAVINLFNSFGYFQDDENAALAVEFARVLRPGGALLIDVANPVPLLEVIADHPRTEQQVVDLNIGEDWRYDPETRRIHNRTRIEIAGKVTERGYDVRLYSHGEMRRLLDKAGLELETAYGEFGGEPFEESESHRLIVVARKPS